MDTKYDVWPKEKLVKRLKELENYNEGLKQSLAANNDSFLNEFKWAGNLGQWFWYYDQNKVLFNDKKTLNLGYDPQEMGNIGFEFFTQKLHPDDYDRVMANMRSHLRGQTPAYEVEYRIRHKEGHYVWYYDRGTVVKRDENGLPLILHGIVFDITESKKAEERLVYLAEHDGLTEIYNRRMLFKHLNNHIDNKIKNNTPFSLVMLDIDLFKNVNDTHGHLVGDDTLIRLVKMIMADKRFKDELYRYGGEEFFLLLPDTNLQGAVELATRLHQTIGNEKFPVIKKLTVSMGVVEYQNKETIDEVIKRVDDLLYKAKRAGRNTIKF